MNYTETLKEDIKYLNDSFIEVENYNKEEYNRLLNEFY